MKKNYILSIGLLIAFILVISLGALNGGFSNIQIKILTNETQEGIIIPSKCYTTMQPSYYFRGVSPSLITQNIDGSLKIYPKNDQKLRSIQVGGTGSMRPTIGGFSEVIVIDILYEDINIGDIITFKTNLRETIHRVVNIENNGTDTVYTTKGDNNNVADSEKLLRNQIKYKVVGVLY